MFSIRIRIRISSPIDSISPCNDSIHFHKNGPLPGLDNACATLLSLPLLFVSPESRGRGRGRRRRRKKKSRFCLKKKKKEGKEAKRVKRSLLGASLRSARCRVFFALFPPGKSFRKQWPELGQLRHRDYAGRDFWTRFRTWTICPSRFCIKFLQRTEILFFIFITFICSYIRWILRFRVFRLIRVYFVVRRIIIIIQFLNN